MNRHHRGIKDFRISQEAYLYGLSAGALVTWGCGIEAINPIVERRKAAAVSDLNDGALNVYQPAFKELYARHGIRGARAFPEWLARFILKHARFPEVNLTAVDIANIVSLMCGVCATVHHLPSIHGALRLDVASERTKFVALGGRKKTIRPGEWAVYDEDRHVLAWLVSHQSERSRLRRSSTSILAHFIEVGNGAAIMRAKELYAELVVAACGGTVVDIPLVLEVPSAA